MNIEDQIHSMSRQLLLDIISAAGLPNSKQWYQRVRVFFRKATEQLSRIGITFDQLIIDKGLPQAAQWALDNWCRSIIVRGKDNIPSEGPLLVVSNHPGAYDALVIAAQLPRQDLHIIASDLPFLRYLHNFSQRVCFIPRDTGDINHRMLGMLNALRHLNEGGSVLLMGSGTIEPDPALCPEVDRFIHRWTDAVNIFLRIVPNVKIVLSAVSHIVSRKWVNHPITWFRRGGLDKRRLAEFGQILQQLIHPGSYFASPRLTFSPTLTRNDLGANPRNNLIERELTLLEEHCRKCGRFSRVANYSPS